MRLVLSILAALLHLLRAGLGGGFPDGLVARQARLRVDLLGRPRDLHERCRRFVSGRCQQGSTRRYHPGVVWDGKRIAFASNRSGSFEIYVMNADGSGVVQVTHDHAYDDHPHFTGYDKVLVMSPPRAATGRFARSLSTVRARPTSPRTRRPTAPRRRHRLERSRSRAIGAAAVGTCG